jgi:hypothetical protein
MRCRVGYNQHAIWIAYLGGCPEHREKHHWETAYMRHAGTRGVDAFRRQIVDDRRRIIAPDGRQTQSAPDQADDVVVSSAK